MLGRHPMASETDLHTIARFNSTEAPFPDNITLQEWIEREVERHSAETAVICDHDASFGVPSLSYSQLNEKANQLAYLLRTSGVTPGQVVAITVERSFAMIVGVLGILKAGGAYLPLSPNHPPARIDYMLNDAGVTTLLVQGSSATTGTFEGTIVDLTNPDVYRGPAENPTLTNRPTDLAYVIYTSGSTGKPKGVMIEHRSVINRLHWMQKAYPIDQRDVILQKTPFYFDVSVWELFWWALYGSKVCFLVPGGEKHPVAIVEAVKQHQVSVMHFVPSMLNVFLEYLSGKPAGFVSRLASVRRVFASGEALSPSHVRKFNDLWGGRTGVRLTNLYGPTEATVDVSYFDCPPHNSFENIPIGRPIDNTRLYVIRGGKEVALGESGELCIAGVGLARGYLNNPALTAEKFVENPVKPGERIYRTGDISRWQPDGNVAYLGREDQQIKVRGLRIELGEVENTIRDYAEITDCVVVFKEYLETVGYIIAYITCKPELDVIGLKAYLKEYLPDYMIPQHFYKIQEVPLTPSGKVDRTALPDAVVGQYRPSTGLTRRPPQAPLLVSALITKSASSTNLVLSHCSAEGLQCPEARRWYRLSRRARRVLLSHAPGGAGRLA